MTRTLERYQKCSYGGPDTAIQNKENEVVKFYQYILIFSELRQALMDLNWFDYTIRLTSFYGFKLG